MLKSICYLFTVITFNLHAQNSTVAFTLAEKDLLPESVAYDPDSQSFYVGSTRKGTITKVDADGNQSTFVASGKFGQWMVIGIKVDPQRDELWFCSSGGGNLVGYSFKDDEEGRPAGIFKVDLNTGELIKKYTLEKPGEVHFFNDLVIDENGDVYTSHMFSEHTIYKIDRDTDQLEPYAKSELIRYPNGLDISNDRKSLFVAHSDGIAKISLETSEATSLNIANDIKLTGRESADGLYFYKNSLIAIQPDLSQVARYRLSMPQNAVMESEILELNHSAMDHPTTGVIVGDTFYYIANAQFEKVNEDGSLAPEISAPTILKIDLK
ncbi:SMP-30/Gluconolaconase/LRE-like region-containing protein [Ekhidna lutea]|uniref:SMP-30/Gluconolaconase/LRE-like region-containing protein n=1 Tax=Ekhidna lutea TaxID=447679 RepID=A0A239MA96_EKHLU|nr:SMP-30/gluconolactonase/LRE family protein [Ekhidna lutea]SNT39897.1 SMP-30/Gluconolaconase/LRE-like region-containing protein [Ekhidna lutea]